MATETKTVVVIPVEAFEKFTSWLLTLPVGTVGIIDNLDLLRKNAQKIEAAIVTPDTESKVHVPEVLD